MLEHIIAVVIGGLVGYYIMNVAIKYNNYKNKVKAYEDFIIEAANELREIDNKVKEMTKK